MSNVPQYSLPGLVHYLQSEWTRNEKDRIQWANEKEEMKATIAKLQSENDRLKRELLENGQDLKQINTDTNVDSLVKARKHLKTRMDEVMYILKGSNGLSIDPLGVKEYVPLAKKEQLPKKKALLRRERDSATVVETVEVGLDDITKNDVDTDNETISGEVNELESPLESPTEEKFPDVEEEVIEKALIAFPE